MKWLPAPVLKSAQDIEDFSRKALEGGASLIGTTLGKIPLLSSVVVWEAKPEAGPDGDAVAEELRDETHYFLVPFRPADCGYTLYSARRLPEGYAIANDLPKSRVFHLPGPGSESVLEKLVLADLTAYNQAPEEGESALMIRLTRVADEIDKESSKVTGGLLLIGGALAFINPALGFGVAAKALFPAVGAKLSKEGFKFLGDSWDGFSRRGRDKAARKAAEQDMNASEVRIEVNPILQTLEKAIATSRAEFDPSLEFDDAPFHNGDYSQRQLLFMTARAIAEVYDDYLEDPALASKAELCKEDLAWIANLAALVTE